MPEDEWYTLSVDDALEKLGSSGNGLAHSEASKRLAEHGPNELVAAKMRGPLSIFLGQFTNFLVIILIFAAAISTYIGLSQGSDAELYDAVVILVIVAFNAAFGFFQEYKAERAIHALKAMAAPKAQAVREGAVATVESKKLVQGDVIVLSAGSKVPADCRVIESIGLHVNEASLTGESVSVHKSVGPMGAKAIINDRANMVFSGTIVERGRGKAVVTATGMRTELGKIAGLVQSEKSEDTPLQKRLDKLGKSIGLAVIGVSALVFAVGYIQNPDDILTGFLTSVSLAVAAVPEGLPAVVTIALALGMVRMSRRHALIRKLQSVETLGAVTVICSDKTGTLTEGKMNVREVRVGGHLYEIKGEGYSPEGTLHRGGVALAPDGERELLKALEAAALCSDSSMYEKDGRWDVTEDPTEGALVVAAARCGLSIDSVRASWPRVGEVGFTSERKRMTTVHRSEGRTLAVLKGAPEVVLSKCAFVASGCAAAPLNDRDAAATMSAYKEMASRGLRVIALATKDLESSPAKFDESSEEGFCFTALFGIMDAPRLEALDAIARCNDAGIRVVMITGDHQLTALAIAKEMNILKPGDQSLLGDELALMSDDELERGVENLSVYARVSPEHKVRIVKALKARGHIVAMTGDGVNDGPALKGADIGVAMGITGTDVAKESAAMVLADDNFATVVAAAEEGRAVYDNMRKFIRYMLSTNSGEVLVIFVASIFGPMLLWPDESFPILVAIQILWINLVTDGLPALALSVEPPEGGIMKRPPRDPKESILAGGIALHIAWVGLLMMSGCLWLFDYGLTEGIEHAHTLCFTTLAFFQLWHVLAIRIEGGTVLSRKFFANPWLLAAVAVSTGLMLAVLYIPALATIFELEPLTPFYFGLCVLVSSSVFVLVEAEKAARRVWERRKAVNAQNSPAAHKSI
ncbi:MAG: cation-translocating P-type ATPase [Methanobacteriota archaeon]